MKMIRIFIAIFVSIFLVTMTVACNNEETNDDTNSVNVDKATFTDETLEYTGEPLAIVVKNLPGGVKVDYTYSLNGEEVSQMIEVGVYDVTAKIKDNQTGKLLKTLTAKLTIKEREVYDEIPNDLESQIELTFGTTYKSFVKNPDDETQLIAAGIQTWAPEKIYFVLSGSDKPLNFLELDGNSIAGVSLVGNTVLIANPGIYDVIMTFPEGKIVPTILVREGNDSSVFYFRGSMNDYQTSDEYLFTIDEASNTASYEIDLALNDTFKIANYYYSVEFNYNPHFKYLNNFTVGGEFGTDPKVVVAGHYKFVIDLETKALTVYCDDVKLEEDRTPNLYLRGTMNNWEAVTQLTRRTEGNALIATIEVQLSVGDEFKIADDSYDLQFDYNSFSPASSHFEASTDGYNNAKVKVAGLYKITVNLNTKAVTVVVDGVTLFENHVAGNGGGNVEQPSVPAGTILYLRGSINNWDTSTKLTQVDNVATITYTFETGDIFKIADASWTNSATFGYPYFAAGVGYFSEGTENGNIVVDQAGTYEISLDLTTYKFTVKKDGEVIIDGSSNNGGGSTEPVTAELFLRGTVNEWGTSNPLTVSGNIASVTVTFAVGDIFKIADASWSDANTFGYSYFASFSYFKEGVENGNIEVVEAGTYEISLDLTTKQITVKKVDSPDDGGEDDEPTKPVQPVLSHLLLRGSINGWGTDNALVLNGDVASITYTFAVGDIFKISDASWSDANTFGYPYFAAATGYFSEGTENGNIVVDQAGTYEISINLTTKQITVTKDGSVILEPKEEQPSTGGITLYLKPNSNWVDAGAWFAIYYWNGTTSGWAKMTDTDGDGIYEATIDAALCTNGVIFCRMNPASQTLDWSNKWDQTVDLKYDGTNTLFTVNDGDWNNANGKWSTK